MVLRLQLPEAVEEREDIRKVLDFLFFCILFFCLTYIFTVKVQELACSTSYGINELLIANKYLGHRLMGQSLYKVYSYLTQIQ